MAGAPRKPKKVRKVQVYFPSIGKAKKLVKVLENGSYTEDQSENVAAIKQGIKRAEKKKKADD